MKKLAFILLVMIAVLLETVAFAEGTEGTCGLDLTWKLDSNGVLIISGTGLMDDYSYGRSEAAPWYSVQDQIQSVVIEEGVTSVGEYAFYLYYDKLTTVTLPDSLTVISDNAFDKCKSLTTINMSKNVEMIGTEAFRECKSLRSVVLPETLKRIEDQAFYACDSLTVITIPAGVEYISESSSFSKSNKLTAVNVADENAYYASVDGVLYNKDKTILLAYPSGKTDSSFTVPETVHKIYHSAFSYNELIRSIIVPGSVESIDYYAFSNCKNLKSISFSEGLISLGNGVFSKCSTLSSVTFPASFQKLGNSVFEECYGLKELLVAEGSTTFKSIDGIMFDYSTKTLVAYPAGRLQSNYAIPDGVEGIGDCAFYQVKNLLHVTFPDSLLSIGNFSFYNCDQLNELTFPKHLVSLGEKAFFYCSSLTSITIPETVRSIDSCAFAYCKKLRDVKITGQTSLGFWAFDSCDNLLDVTIMNPNVSFDKYGVFNYCNASLIIKGLAGSTAEAMAKEKNLQFEAVTFEEEAGQEEDDDWTCAGCSAVNHGGTFCTECGAKRPETQVCKNCGYENKDMNYTFKFCPECGTKYE